MSGFSREDENETSEIIANLGFRFTALLVSSDCSKNIVTRYLAYVTLAEHFLLNGSFLLMSLMAGDCSDINVTWYIYLVFD